MRSVRSSLKLATFAALLVGAGLLASGVALDVGRAVPGPAPHKVYVCKYVGTPGVDERLQTGQNPIETDWHSLPGFPGYPDGTFPFAFADAQGNSVAIGWVGEQYPVLGLGDCPTPPAPAKGVLTVVKVVVNNNGGTKTASDFSFTVDGQPYAFESDGSNELVLDPGSYAVAEVAAAGYTSSVDDGSVTVVAGHTVTVTITNDDVGTTPETTGDASVACVLPDGYYRVNGTLDGQAADSVEPGTIPGDFAGSTQVLVTRGDTSHRVTVTTDGTCRTTLPPTTETTPTETTPTDTMPTEPTETETTPAETTAAPKPSVIKTKPATSPTEKAPQVQVKGAYKAPANAPAKAPTKLAHTP